MKHDERRNVHDGVDDSVWGERGHVQKGPSNSMAHHSQETVQALTDALLELQMELRERCHECEVLRATVEALSSELRTSDSSLEEAQLQAEKLDFRLQAVSYCYQSDLVANEETERMALSGKRSKKDKKLLAADKKSNKKSKKKGKTSKNEKSERKSTVEKKKDKKHKTSRSRAEREPPAEAECRDDINSQPRPEPKAEPELEVEAEPAVTSISQRQAAF
jgi:chromosome segregation ATPase